MIEFQTDGVEMPDINDTSTAKWLEKVSASYGYTIG